MLAAPVKAVGPLVAVGAVMLPSNALRYAVVATLLLAVGCGDDSVGSDGSSGTGGGDSSSTPSAGPTTSTSNAGPGSTSTGSEGGAGGGGSEGGAGGGGPACSVLPDVLRGPENGHRVLTFDRTASGFAYAADVSILQEGVDGLALATFDPELGELTSAFVSGPTGTYFWDAIPTADGAWIVVGQLDTEGPIGGLELPHETGGSDGFVAKIDATGQASWLRAIGSPDVLGYEEKGVEIFADGNAYGVALRPDGGVVVLADLEGSTDLGAFTVEAGDGLAAVIAFDAEGEAEWFVETTTRYASVSIDDAGRILLADAEGTRCLDPDGDTVWTADEGGSLNLGADGAIYVVGGHYLHTKLTKLDGAGAIVWSHPLDATGWDITGSNIDGGVVTAAPDGRVVLALSCGGSIDFGLGDDPVDTCDDSDICVVWLDPLGNPIDGRVYGDGWANVSDALILEDDDSLLLASTTFYDDGSIPDDAFIYGIAR